MWLDNVFQLMNMNDRPSINLINYDSHDKYVTTSPITSNYSSNLDTASSTTYSVINSVIINPSSKTSTDASIYKDRDNPQTVPSTSYPEFKWIKSLDGTWKPPPSSPQSLSSTYTSSLAFLSSSYPHCHFPTTTNSDTIETINKTSSSNAKHLLISKQSDSGANTSATNNINLLTDVQYIDPVPVNSASNQAQPMKMLAVGKIHLRTITGHTINPTCYYSPDIDGTVISPDAICREFSNEFRGFSKICNTKENEGFLTLDPVDWKKQDSHLHIILPLTSHNNLWYHDDAFAFPRAVFTGTNPPRPTIRKLSQSANFELWHQRLCHPGNNIMANIHQHVKNVPPLKGNSFWKCPSCLSGKFDKSYHIKIKPNTKTSSSTLKIPPSPRDDIYLPNAQPGQHFHCDFGFVHSKDFQQQDEHGRTQTSIDGKRSYLLIIDRATRYTWVYLSSSKLPPIDFCKSVLHKFKSNCKHKTIRCDQGELATSTIFNEMIVNEGFILERTGAANSKQNGMAERPHRTFGNMMRCVLLNAGLGPEYWSYALLHCVYVKNRLPHVSIKTTPFQAMTGIKPDLNGLRIFGSRVVIRNTETKTGKLDMNHIRHGIFVGFTGTTKNVYYIDDKSRKLKIGSWIKFDEAHMTVPAQHAPLAAQALQRVGYHVHESDTSIDDDATLTVHLHSATAKPIQPSIKTNMYLLHLDINSTVLKPSETKLLPTGNSFTIPPGYNLSLNPIVSEDIPHLQLYPGHIESSKLKELYLVVHNNGPKEIVISEFDELATISLNKNRLIPIQVQPYSKTTKPSPKKRPHQRLPLTSQQEVQRQLLAQQSPTTARAAKLSSFMNLSFEMPFDISLSNDPYEYYTHRYISLQSRSPTLGMKLQQCKQRNCPQLLDCLPGQAAAKLPNWRSELRNSYITAINDMPVHSTKDIITHISTCKQNKLKDIKVTFATIHPQAMHPQLGIPQLYHDQLAHIAHHIFDIQHHQSQSSSHIINKIKKKKFNTFTLRELKTRDDWDQWNASIFKQLNQYDAQSTFDEPQPLPQGSNLLSLCWVYLIKSDGTLKARCVCNGSPRFRGTVTLAETYASSLDQTGGRCFWAAAAINNYVVIGADASNAFAEAPPPVAPLYVRIDENYKRWYKHKYPDKPSLPDDYVLRVKKALQGHPESPRLWATLINNIITKLNLKPCTHEPNLYYTDNYNGTNKRVLFLRQVDDFAIACEDRTTAATVINDINSKMSIDVKELGMIERFNGVDVEQRREYIKLHNHTYISKLIQQHPWLQNDTEPMHTHPLPMHHANQYQHDIETATPLTPTERQKLEHEYGFSYRQAVGEIIYAMITCRPDISFPIIKLSQYSTCPAAIHYDALKHLYRYLKATKSDGIYYWRSTPREDLPKGDIPVLKSDANYEEDKAVQRQHHTSNTLHAYVDSNHASDCTHRRSVSGYHVKLAGGAVFYKSQVQSIVAQSSTEAEFIAAAEAGKQILYLRTIMEQIGLPQNKATVLFEDNQGALLMAQAGQPTKRTKHIDIKYFAIQDWVDRDLLTFRHIATTDNSSDALTKATPRTLFYRHNNHIMGKVIPSYVNFVSQSYLKIQTCVHHIKRVAQNIYTAMSYDNFEQGGIL